MKLRILLLSILSTITLTAGALGPLPSETEMREYLEYNADQNAVCEYLPKHFVDMKARVHVIKPVIFEDGHYFDRLYTEEELVYLTELLKSAPALKLEEAISVGFSFVVVPEASEYDVLVSFYTIKKALEESGRNFYLVSSGPCPGGVSVNNF